jgi:hypothetical protein
MQHPKNILSFTQHCHSMHRMTFSIEYLSFRSVLPPCADASPINELLELFIGIFSSLYPPCTELQQVMGL